MTASEFAFLALGLVLGVASGSAIVVVLGSRPPAREVRLTVGHDAVPKRAATLSSDAFMAHSEPARGGPADRRRLDRDAPANDPPPPSPFAAPGVPGRPVMSAPSAFATATGGPLAGPIIRTTVPSWPARTPGPVPSPRPAAPDRPVMTAVPAMPERDPSIDALRIQAVLAAQHAQAAGRLTASALLQTKPVDAEGEVAAPAARVATAEAVDVTPAIIRILRGDHRVLLRVVEELAGADDAMRRPWQAAIVGLAESLIRGAIQAGTLTFPVGNPFWDTFTTAQCRTIAGSLAASGFRFDGIDGWADDHVPTYRDMTAAVAVAGTEPRRIRAWPTQEQIAGLYREVTVAADDFLVRRSPDLDLVEVRELAGTKVPELQLLWQHWDLARPVLAGQVRLRQG
ncbi:MAG: hypothetical protein EPO36_09950 [Chloroflexota bacterium]|nr:MAG: hypothetical protein EPO36_09950 [Chloroflexota bacterium]